jgi:hypothetical protein
LSGIAGYYHAFGFVSQSAGYAYHGDPVAIYGRALMGDARPLASANFPSILVGADRSKLTANWGTLGHIGCATQAGSTSSLNENRMHPHRHPFG